MVLAMVAADFATVGRIELGAIIPRSFHLVRLEWRRLAILAVLFLWAPYELYAFAYGYLVQSQGGLQTGPVKLAHIAGYLSLITSYNLGICLSLEALFRRLDGGERPARPLFFALPAMLVGVVLQVLGNAPTLAAMFTGPPTDWASYIGLILTNSLILFGLNLVVGSAMPVALEERKNPARALLRAATLSSGNRWRLAPVILVYQGAFVVGYIVLLIAGAALARSFASHLGYVWIALASIPSTAASALIYRELRRIRDGLTDVELSGVFD
ncbi:hypothetical protein [Phenylobacterium montanum]|uniref:Uncharacterized protein n=1 Tax=Phenylobacterium montanum TaxID=2823693 RepID=A0A975ISY7_9CAUL|nr:hypothetical protein [Caulobacter sp. S6]QUD86175.1 hypothetical protein KCG34_13805 [Caulobacter sp. S6]